MKKLGRYEIIEELGRGGFATVYKARDTQLNRLVALKVLHSGWSNDLDFVRRFYQEAETAAQFNHPNIVTIYDVGEIEGQLFISMEYIPGQNLQQWLDEKGRPLTVPEALPILQPLAAALDFAHKKGVVHRDIKPGNVMIHETDGSLRVVLTDFGLVKAMEKSVYATSMDRILGTPEYMAPEQTDPNRQDEVGPHTDRYAFGILTYRLLTGRVPFPGNSISTLHAHANLDVPHPQQVNVDLPVKVVAPLLQMLAKTPPERFGTATAFVAALRTANQSQAASTTASLNTGDDAKLFQGNRTIVGFLGVMGCIVAIGLVITLFIIVPGLIPDADNTNDDRDMTITSHPGEIAATANTNPTPTLSNTPRPSPTVTILQTSTNSPLDSTPEGTIEGVPTLRPTLTPTVTPTIDPSIPPPNPTLGSIWTRPSDNMIMVYVPAGTFLMGSDPEIDLDADGDEFPQHSVTLDGFWIDQTEVTNEQYATCVQEGSCDASSYADNSSYNGNTQPVVGVSWFDAEDYCTWAWAEGQLPTEAQWEYAARGDDGRLYPWAMNLMDKHLLNFCDTNCSQSWKDDNYDDGYALTAPVGSYPGGTSWVNALDMAGNVWEWAQDWYDSEYYENAPGTNPDGPDTGDNRVLRGGSWFNNAANVRSANRHYVSPTYSDSDIGFRCAAPGP